MNKEVRKYLRILVWPAVTLAIAIAAFVVCAHSPAALVDYLRVILAWPVAALIIVIIVLVRLGGSLEDLIRRAEEGQLGKARMKFSRQPSREVPEAETPPPLSEAAKSDLQDKMTAVSTAKNEAMAAAEELIRAERRVGLLWEYSYLAYFLAAHTHTFLAYLARETELKDVATYFAYWDTTTLPPTEHAPMLDALIGHGLARTEGDDIEITAKGREYYEWRTAELSKLGIRPHTFSPV